MSAYIARLNQRLAMERELPIEPRNTLRERFLDWYNGLPEISRNRAFAMAELEAALCTQGKYLSTILLNLGWHRGRRWDSKGQYSRYWLPPRFENQQTKSAT